MNSGERRVLYYWHSVANHLLTTGLQHGLGPEPDRYGDLLQGLSPVARRSIPIRSNRFGIEPEITIKFAKRQASIYEMPISYHGRSYEEGKKIGC